MDIKHLEEMDKYRDLNKEGNPDYKAIRKLHAKLKTEGFEHEFKRTLDGYSIGIKEGKRWISIIEHFGSYGNSKDLLEVWTSELEKKGSDPIGYLSPEETFGIFQYWQLM